VAPADNLPGTAVSESASDRPSRARSVKPGHLTVSELAADRAAALSPFGDDQTFPLPVEELTYKPTAGTPTSGV
jgi:hypothetical protein